MAGTRGNGEGSIYQRRDGAWCAAVSLPDGRRKVLYGRTRAEASRKLTDTLKAVGSGLPVPGVRLTVGAYLADWLATLQASGSIRATTHYSYTQYCQHHLIPGLGRLSLATLTPNQVDRFLAERAAAGLSARARRYMRTVLRVALNTALRQGLVMRNAASLATAPKAERPDIHPFTPEEATTFLAAIHGNRLEALYLLVLATGLREGEALAVGQGDVDLATGTLRVRHNLVRLHGEYRREPLKTDKSRRDLALPASVIAALQAHIDRQRFDRQKAEEVGRWAGNEWGLLFTSETGRPIHYATANQRFQAVLKAAGLPKRHFYTLRHSAASLLIAQGADLHDVKNQLGHSTIALTSDTYAHVYDARKRELAAGMDTFLIGAGSGS